MIWFERHTSEGESCIDIISPETLIGVCRTFLYAGVFMPERCYYVLLCDCSALRMFCFVDILITVQCGQANNVLMIELRAYDIGY